MRALALFTAAVTLVAPGIGRAHDSGFWEAPGTSGAFSSSLWWREGDSAWET